MKIFKNFNNLDMYFFSTVATTHMPLCNLKLIKTK